MFTLHVEQIGENVLSMYGFKCVNIVALTFIRASTTLSYRHRQLAVTQGSMLVINLLVMLSPVH